MALSNRQRVQGAQDALLDELVVYVERALKHGLGNNWVDRVAARYSSPPGLPLDRVGKPYWDIQLLTKVIGDFWHEAFAEKLKMDERNHVFELRSWRNALAHDQPFTYDDTYRALDTMQRVAKAMGLAVAAELLKERDEVMRIKLREQERGVSRSLTPVEGRIPEGLKAWREIIVPHADVREGKFQAAEFAADLAQVFKGEASTEYGEPRAFFGRTFVTVGLRDLLSNALTRLSKGEGDPVVELQTNFGGGKTHSMLALYHLFGAVSSGELPGLEEVHTRAKVTTAPSGVKRAVLVGNHIGTGQYQQPDGTVTNTLWGELAYQLAGAPGYALVAQADQHRTNPGTELLIRLLKLASPCLILIDEWVAHLRELYGRQDLPAGSFESNISFAQSLTEAAKSVPHSLLVASLPEHTTETVGEGGSAALSALKQTFKRVQSTWLPANPEESFEIVRRRLFEPVRGDAHRQQDAVIKAFSDHYQANKNDFPSGVAEAEYTRKLKNSYPIHPALFDALFGAWSTLERFQRTRGVLRLMAAVIHRLWQSGEKALMIMPGLLPLDDQRVQAELRNYLGETWEAIMNQEVDGPNSLPVQTELEDKSGRLASLSAARRVTRSVFMSTAPCLASAHPGLEIRQVYLSSVQPGEQIGPFSDALRRVAQQAVHLYADGSHYWFSTRPSLNRKAADLAAGIPEEEVLLNIHQRLRSATSKRRDFTSIHLTDDSAEVKDEYKEPGVQLVILPPSQPHTRGSKESPALERARQLVLSKGNGDRLGRNNLVVLAADRTRLDELYERVRLFLAWKKILDEAHSQDLAPSDQRQADKRMQEVDKSLEPLLSAVYPYLLTPHLVRGEGSEPAQLAFEEERLNGESEWTERIGKKLIHSGKLTRQFGGLLLKMQLEREHLWNERPHLPIRQLLEYYAQYLYLERVTSAEVLLKAIQEGVAAQPPYFAYADGFQEGRYQNLKLGTAANIRSDAEAMLVSLAAAEAQLQTQAELQTPSPEELPVIIPPAGRSDPSPLPTSPPLPQRIVIEGHLNQARLTQHFQTICDEVIQQVLGAGGQVKVAVTIDGSLDTGVDTALQRNLSENAKLLGLQLNVQ